MTNGYVWILPAVTAAGWILSWWGPRRLRWGLLSAALVVSVFCVVVALLVPRTPVAPNSDCRPALLCISATPIYWAEAGLIGFGIGFFLMVATVVVEAIWGALELRRGVVRLDRR